MTKIDKLLEEDAKLHCNLGSDSTQEERNIVKSKSIEIYKKIRDIDFQKGNSFLILMDKKQ
jgi:hypothetical protein